MVPVTISVAKLHFSNSEVGVDFFDTYSSVSKATTIRVLIAFACVFNEKIHQMNVKTVFF